jgi:hypothetical protein
MVKNFFFFFRKSSCLRYNVVKYCRAGQTTEDNIVRRMCFAYWIPKATKTLIIYNAYFSSLATMVSQTCFVLRLYIHCLSCCILDGLMQHVSA